MAEGHEIVNVVIVVALDDNIDDGVEDGALFHGRFRRRRGDVAFDFFGHAIEAVHVENLLPDLVLIFPDASIGIDFLGPEVLDYRHRAFAEDVLLKNIRQAGLGIDGK